MQIWLSTLGPSPFRDGTEGAELSVLAVLSTLGRDVERLNDAIRSLRVHTATVPFEILVVNNSGLPTITGLEPVDHVYSPGVNLGYVGALEFARRSYSRDFLWSIQDDMTLSNDVLAVLAEAMERLPCLAVSSPVLVRDGLVPAMTRAGVFTNQQRTRWQNYPPADTAPEDLPSDTDYSFVSGSGALFRTSALSDVGGFNLGLYPLMHVDVDICARLLTAGWTVSLEPEAQISHQIQGSTPKILGATLDRLNRTIVEAQLERQAAEEMGDAAPIDAGLLFEVARRASFLFLEVSREAEARLGVAETQLRDVQHEREALMAERDGLFAERAQLVAERDWWHSQFHRLRRRRSVKAVLAMAEFVSPRRSRSRRRTSSPARS